MSAMNSGSPLRWIFRAALIIVCVLVLGIAGEAMWMIRSAESCFRVFGNLAPGKSTQKEAAQLLQYRPFVDESGVEGESAGCTSQSCSIGFSFESRLSWWHLIRPRRGFEGNVEIRNGIVDSVHFIYAEGDLLALSVTARPSEAPPSMPELGTGLSISALSPERHQSIARVKNFADLPVASRRQLLEPNVWCLIRISGCQTAASILPGARSLTFE